MDRELIEQNCEVLIEIHDVLAGFEGGDEGILLSERGVLC